MFRKGLVSAAAVVLALGSAAWADQCQSVAGNGGNATPELTTAAPLVPIPIANAADNTVYGDEAVAAPAPRAPLMWALDQVGMAKPLDDLHINLSGYVDMGYIYDATVPKNTTPARSTPGDLILFPGDYKNSFVFDQVDFAVARAIDATQNKFDVGFDVEGIFGDDAFYTHSNGILDNTNKHVSATGAGAGGDAQLDLEQAYIDFAVPVGTGLTLEAGKFDTLLGYESINPTTNAFYTHSYIFSYGVPFTQTGILGSYNLMDTLQVTAGVTRGWNQSTSDNNGAVDFLGELTWTPTKALTLKVNLSEGPQRTGDNGDYWSVPEIIAIYQVADQLSVAADLLYGDAPTPLGAEQWYAAAGYADYKLCDYATVNLRGEFYHDGHGFSSGVGAVPFHFGFNGPDINFTEATAGVALKPLPDSNLFQSLTFRPEIRGDFADHAVFDGKKFTELTAAIDAYWKF